MIRFSFALLVLLGCSVDHTGLNESDSGIAPGCMEDVDCDDEIACTVDSCDSETCSNVADDALCSVGERCAPTESGCVMIGACLPTECAENMRIPAQCRFGECVGDSCVPNDGCEEGESCCGGAGGHCAACDDGNPCTVDSCMTGCDPTAVGPGECCVHDPAPLVGTECDDGLFCTTGDACNADGECVGPGPSSCEELCSEEMDACIGCRTDDGCPPRNRGTASPCRIPSGEPICTLAGELDQPIFVGRCIANECDYATEDSVVEACTLEPAGTRCRDDQTVIDDVCEAESRGCTGTQAATLRTFSCSAAGACAAATSPIRVDCNMPAGIECAGAPEIVSMTPCDFAGNTCSRNGTRTNTVRLRECTGDGMCGFASMTTDVPDTCRRANRDGRRCMPMAGECNRSDMTSCTGTARLGSLCAGGSCDTDMPDTDECDVAAGTSCGRVAMGAAFCDTEPGECGGMMRQVFQLRECDGDGGCMDTETETETTGTCSLPEGDPCDDGDLCTTGDSCSAAGACVAGAPVTCTASDCTGCGAGSCRCDPGTGDCGCG